MAGSTAKKNAGIHIEVGFCVNFAFLTGRLVSLKEVGIEVGESLCQRQRISLRLVEAVDELCMRGWEGRAR